MSKMSFIRLFIGFLALTATVVSSSRIDQEPTCDCVCRDSFMDTAFAHKPLCKVISRFEEELWIVKKEIGKKITLTNDIDALKDIVEEQGHLIKTLQDQVDKLSSSSNVNEALPGPASLVMKEDHMQENLDETRVGFKTLDDKLKSSLPMDSRVTQVEEIVLLTLETMNKTIFEDHLKKLYYKVDGIVYKNETEKLDERLNHVEMVLMNAGNMNTSLKFPKELTDILSAMNQTIMGKLAEEEIRLASLENKTTKLDELEVLQDKMTNLLNKTKKLDEIESLQHQTSVLLNATEVMQTRAIDLWTDIQNVRIATNRLEKELNDQLSMTNRTVSSVQQEISGKLQTLAEELSSLKAEFTADQASLPKLQADLKTLAETDAISENRIRDLATALEKMTKEIAILTSVWNNSSSIPTAQGEPFKSSKDTDESEDSSKRITQSKNTEESNDGSKRITQSPGRQVRCRKPSINDEHLLVTLEEDSQGVQTLVFGCRPIGRYAVEEGPVALECKDGFWHGRFPKCIRLKDEAEIIALSEEFKQPPNSCFKESGDVPDVTDCSFYYKCRDGVLAGREKCPQGLRFDAQSRRCQGPDSAQCAPSLDVEAEKLADLIPTILVEPDTVDKPSSLMVTNGSGQLLVFPNTIFELHCLFPENQLGPPTWEIEYFPSDTADSPSIRNSKYRSVIEFMYCQPWQSGKYTCKSPYNKKNSITVVIEAIRCPVFYVDEERKKGMIHHGHPNNGYAILSTTAEFFCEGGSSIISTCLPSGTWSRSVPTMEECPPSKAKIWGCEVFERTSSIDPVVRQYDYRKHEIQFRCPGDRRLVGVADVKCVNNTWTPPFPKCE